MSRSTLKRLALAAASFAVVVATFAYFLPKIADYGQVWDVVQQLTWRWAVVLLLAVLINLATFAFPWQVVLPGLSFVQAMKMTQASTALSIILPGGFAAGAAGSFGILRRWGFSIREVTRAITLTSLWNQFLNFSFPVVAVFLLTMTGRSAAFALAIAAFIGVAALGIVLTGFVLVLVSNRLAEDIGNVTARFANWARAKVRRGPVDWSGESFERFRVSAGEFLVRRWHTLTAATLIGSLSVFALLLVCLRSMGVTSSEVGVIEAFAAWSLLRIIASIPITPGGLGIVELGLTGTLVGFGGNNAEVVAAVLLFRVLTAVPTLILGVVGALTWRRHRPGPAVAISPGPGDEPAEAGSEARGISLRP